MCILRIFEMFIFCWARMPNLLTAKKLFNKDGYFTKAMQRKRNAKLHIDARLMQRAWDSKK